MEDLVALLKDVKPLRWLIHGDDFPTEEMKALFMEAHDDVGERYMVADFPCLSLLFHSPLWGTVRHLIQESHTLKFPFRMSLAHRNDFPSLLSDDSQNHDLQHTNS